LATESLREGSATAWFERLYTEAGRGDAIVPWDRGEPHPVLVEWCESAAIDGDGKSAVVVGCGRGNDAEYLASRGFATTAFDISQTALAQARERYPDSSVDYQVADLLDLPDQWHRRFDLVAELMTVQSLPRNMRRQAIDGVAELVGQNGTLIVVGPTPDVDVGPGPPWPLDRQEIESFAASRLEIVAIDRVPRLEDPLTSRWRAVFHARR
jgi:2-polyprenyl-3-methyl-5-hydroxy-6-metoxy-1,4-benzoquinol methylase